jgi:nitrate reductase delta subunit
MKAPKPMSLTLRALARLLSYPDAELRAHLDELRNALHAEAAIAPPRLAEIDALIASIGARSALDAEADYVQLFDSGRRTSLHLFEHVHGDSRDRGPAMIDLAQTFEAAGLYLAEGEMPDHLPVVLEYASTQPPREARAFLAEMAHILNVIFSALQQRGSRYASVLGALIELAGEKAAPVQLPDEEAIDDSWAEPAAFDGCSSAGQSRPGQPQPIQIQRKPQGNAATGARP